MVKDKIGQAKKSFDWFLDKKQINQVIILLFMIIGALGYFYFENQKEFKKELIYLKKKTKKQDSIINILRLENNTLRLQSLLLLDAFKDDPNPRWITDAKTHIVVSINDAYEKIHLFPLGFRKYDLVGTTGEHIFGKANIEVFNRNNDRVIREGRAITFKNELNTTVKFPIGKNNYIYAIGGYEYLNH